MFLQILVHISPTIHIFKKGGGDIICWVLRPAAAGVAKLAARDAQLRVQMLLF